MAAPKDRPMREQGEIGRPSIKIDKDELIRMMQIQCTQDEICHILGIDHETLRRYITKRLGSSFEAMYKQHSAEGRKSIRRTLFHLMLNGEKDSDKFRAAQWLSKQHIGMKDRVENEIIPMKPYVIEDTLTGKRVELGTQKTAQLEEQIDG